MTIGDIQNLKELLSRMQQADPTYRVYISHFHKYRLGTPLPEMQLQVFEQSYGITLPADFRFFLNNVGDGGATRTTARIIGVNSGAGPGCGVLPLKESVRGCDPTKPFPLRESTESRPYPGIELWGDTQPYPGLLEICYQGGARFSYLVVNGASYGTVWDMHGDTAVGDFIPTGLSFEAWYRRWVNKLIDVALPLLERERIIERIKVGMTKSEVIAICGGKWKVVGPDDFRFLKFEHLVTEFMLDSHDLVGRIVNHVIFLGI